jgi:hypothetical protein
MEMLNIGKLNEARFSSVNKALVIIKSPYVRAHTLIVGFGCTKLKSRLCHDSKRKRSSIVICQASTFN